MDILSNTTVKGSLSANKFILGDAVLDEATLTNTLEQVAENTRAIENLTSNLAVGVFFPDDTFSSTGIRILREYKEDGTYTETSAHVSNGEYVDDTGLQAATYIADLTTTDSSGNTIVNWSKELGTFVPTYSYGPNGDTFNSFDKIAPWGGIHKKNYKTTVNGTEYDNWFINIPKFYYMRKKETRTFKGGSEVNGTLIMVSSKPYEGFELHPGFKRANGTVMDYYGISAFHASYITDADGSEFLMSQDYWNNGSNLFDYTSTYGASSANHIIGELSSASKTLNNATVAGMDVTNETFLQMTFVGMSMIQMLFLVEFANMDSQRVIAGMNYSKDGLTSGSGATGAIPGLSNTFLCGIPSSFKQCQSALASGSIFGGAHYCSAGGFVEGFCGYNFYARTAYTYTTSMMYRGIENIYTDKLMALGDVRNYYSGAPGDPAYLYINLNRNCAFKPESASESLTKAQLDDYDTYCWTEIANTSALYLGDNTNGCAWQIGDTPWAFLPASESDTSSQLTASNDFTYWHIKNENEYGYWSGGDKGAYINYGLFHTDYVCLGASYGYAARLTLAT